MFACVEALHGDADEGVDQHQERSTVVAVQPIERFLDRRRSRHADLAAQCSTRCRQHDRQRSAVATRSPLGEAGVDQPVDESNRAGVRESCRLGEILSRATGEAWRVATRRPAPRPIPGCRFGGVADPVYQRQCERPDDIVRWASADSVTRRP